MKRGHVVLAVVARRVPAHTARGRRRRPGGRHLPAGHDVVHGHGTRPDRPRGRLLPRHRRDDHQRPDLAGQRGRRDLRDERRQGRGLPRLRRCGHLGHLVAHDVVAAGTDSGADITDSTIGHDFLGQGEESGADILRTTIGHDMRLLGLGGGTHLESVTIGHDFFASTPQTVQTGHNAPDTPGGPVKIGHDFAIDGSPGFPFVFDGLCNLSVGRDLSITNRTVNLGIGARSPLRRERSAGEHDRTGPDRERQHGRVRRLRALAHPGR